MARLLRLTRLRLCRLASKFRNDWLRYGKRPCNEQWSSVLGALRSWRLNFVHIWLEGAEKREKGLNEVEKARLLAEQAQGQERKSAAEWREATGLLNRDGADSEEAHGFVDGLPRIRG